MTHLQRTRELATTITAIGAAVAAVTAVAMLAGAVVTVAVVGAVLGVLGVIAFQRISRIADRAIVALGIVEHQFAVNGADGDLPEDLQGKPMRTLVIGCVERLDRGDRRFDAIDARIDQLEQEAS